MSELSLSKAAIDHNRISYGLTLMVFSVLLSPLIDIFSKLAIATVPSAEITAARFLLQIVFILPIVLGAVRSSISHGARVRACAARRPSGGDHAFLHHHAEGMEVADAIAIFFVEPIILTILGSIFLKETIGWRRYTACAVGFLGSLLVIQPSMQEVGLVALLPIVAAFGLAVFLLVTRMVAQNEDPWSMQFHAGIWGGLFCLALLWFGEGSGSSVFDPVWPDGRAWYYLLWVGVTATISGVLGVYAYRAAPASVLAPLQYLEIVSATIFGWLVFGDLPDALKWLGIAIIIGSGLYIIWRERQVQKTAGIAPVSPAI